MTDQHAAAEEDRAEKESKHEKSFWAFTAADMRNVILGVIGGLVTVMIVAVALIVRRHLGNIRGTAAFWLVISGGPCVLLVLAWLTNKVDRLKWLTVLILLILGLALVGIVGLGLLLFLGEAAGIK